MLYNQYYPQSLMQTALVVRIKSKVTGNEYLYCVGTHNLKATTMRPKDFGTLYVGKKCHNYKNKRK